MKTANIKTVEILIPVSFTVPLDAPAGAHASEEAIERALVDGLLLVDPEMIASGDLPDHRVFRVLSECEGIFDGIDPRAPGAQDEVAAIIKGEMDNDRFLSHQARLAAAYVIASGWLDENVAGSLDQAA